MCSPLTPPEVCPERRSERPRASLCTTAAIETTWLVPELGSETAAFGVG
jgi:hypothetical protein